MMNEQLNLFTVTPDGSYTYTDTSSHLSKKEGTKKVPYGDLSRLTSSLQETLTNVTEALDSLANYKEEIEDAEGNLETLQDSLNDIIENVENLEGVSIYLDSLDLTVDF